MRTCRGSKLAVGVGGGVEIARSAISFDGVAGGADDRVVELRKKKKN